MLDTFCSNNRFTRLPEVLGRCEALEMVGFKANRLNCPNDRLVVIEEACLHRSMELMRETLKELPSAPIITKEVLDFATEEEGD